MTVTSLNTSDKVFQIAAYFIKKSQDEKKEITNKKLQKLLYYAQAWSYTLRDQKMFDNVIEAWVHGPAIRVVYRKFSDYKWSDLANKFSITNSNISKITTDEKELLDKIWEVYGKYTATDLEVLTHSEEPWQKAREGLEPYQASNNVIKLSCMKSFYGKRQTEA